MDFRYTPNNVISLLFLILIIVGWTYSPSQILAQSVPDDPYHVEPALIGEQVPDINYKKADGSSVPFSELVSQKPTIFIYYRGGWCPYCNRHMAEIQRIEQDLVDMGYQILAASADRPEKLPQSVQKHNLNYTLLSDNTMAGARAMGLAYKVDQELVQRYKENGIDLEEASGMDHHQLPVPAVYIIGQDGTFLFNYVNPDYHRRIPSAILLTAAQEFNDQASQQ
jgi:peroxiredoxin